MVVYDFPKCSKIMKVRCWTGRYMFEPGSGRHSSQAAKRSLRCSASDPLWEPDSPVTVLKSIEIEWLMGSYARFNVETLEVSMGLVFFVETLEFSELWIWWWNVRKDFGYFLGASIVEKRDETDLQSCSQFLRSQTRFVRFRTNLYTK